MSFRDHFSARSDDYARYRPTYPVSLYEWLAGLVPDRELALDCATGSGQAALGLADHFDRVLGIDGSPEQLSRAAAHAQIGYAVAYVEAAPVRAHSIDLITVAAALHWFDHDRFYADARRVLRPGGVIAAWSYYMFESEPAIDAVMDRYANDILRDYWPEQMHLNQDRYANTPFPFPRIDAPDFFMEAEWGIEETVGFMTTWSAPQRYERERGTHPLDLVVDDLRAAWGDPRRRLHIRWPLHLLVGRVER
jgi:SAM-dependent methyltransferase